MPITSITFFHAAPIDEIKTYIEDMALMGFNALNMLCPSINLKKNDLENIEKENQRLYSFFKIGQSLGMKIITFIQVSATYKDFPKEFEFTKHDTNEIFHCLKRNNVNDIYHERVRPICPEYD